MASRIFGTATARFLRNTTTLASVTSATSNFAGGGNGSLAAWKILAAAAVSTSLSMELASSDTLEVETTTTATTAGESSGREEDGRAKASEAVHLLFHQWKALLPTMATACEAIDPIKLDADSEAEVEATLKRRITSKEELNQRHEQRNKFLQTTHAKAAMRRRTTNVGRFSLVSETAQNPSVPVLVMVMTGKPYFAKDFRRLYEERQVAEKHPRFGARLDATKTHFLFDDDNDDSDNRKHGIVNGKKRQGVSSKDNVKDVIYPTIPIAELKDRINDASLYEPLDLNSRLWEAWTATGGAMGQSGAISANDSTNETKSQVAFRGDEKNVESLLLFRAHHCMADGVSLGALFGDLMDEGPEIQAKIQGQIKLYKAKRKGTPWWKKILFLLYYWIWGSMKALLYQAYLFAISWYDKFEHDDPWIILKGIYTEKRKSMKDGKGQTVPPRSLSWDTIAPVDEVKRVAAFYSKVNRRQTGQKSKVTINDIFCSCASAAIVKQLAYHRVVNPKLSLSSSQKLSLPSMNLIIPVHLQGGILLPGQGLGNKIGAIVSRIPGERIASNSIDRNDRAVLAQERLIQVHSVLNARKQTPIAVMSYLMAGVMGYLSPSSSSLSGTDDSTGYSVGSSPSSWTPWLFRKAHANASLVVTNVRGPEQLVHMEGRPIRAVLGFLPLPAGVPVGLVVKSYDNQISLTVTAEEYAVPDADQFLGWVREEYELLKRRADEAEGTNSNQ